jgi:hypothetical protein
MKRKSYQWWSTITSISTKRTITFNFNSLIIEKTTTYDVGNPDHLIIMRRSRYHNYVKKKSFTQLVVQEEFEDAKGVTRILIYMLCTCY